MATTNWSRLRLRSEFERALAALYVHPAAGRTKKERNLDRKAKQRWTRGPCELFQFRSSRKAREFARQVFTPPKNHAKTAYCERCLAWHLKTDRMFGQGAEYASLVRTQVLIAARRAARAP